MGKSFNRRDLALRTKFAESENRLDVEVSYLESDESRMALIIHLLLDTGFMIENIMFIVFKERFELDAPLGEMRSRFGQRHRDLREAILQRYGVDEANL